MEKREYTEETHSIWRLGRSAASRWAFPSGWARRSANDFGCSVGDFGKVFVGFNLNLKTEVHW